MLMLLNSCEKNASAQGLDTDHLMVHASASKGSNFRRRRRKQNFGYTMKTANVEMILMERIPHDYVRKAVKKKVEHAVKEEMKKLAQVKESQEKMRETAEKMEKHAEKHLDKEIHTHADERKGRHEKKERADNTKETKGEEIKEKKP
jgi:hypothetical protein